MARRANQTFVTWADGNGPRWFKKSDVVPDEIADKVLGLTYDDGSDKPTKRAARKAAAKSDD